MGSMFNYLCSSVLLGFLCILAYCVMYTWAYCLVKLLWAEYPLSGVARQHVGPLEGRHCCFDANQTDVVIFQGILVDKELIKYLTIQMVNFNVV